MKQAPLFCTYGRDQDYKLSVLQHPLYKYLSFPQIEPDCTLSFSAESATKIRFELLVLLNE